MSLETTIKVSRSLRDALQAQKKPQETYNDYIVKLIEHQTKGEL